MILRARPISSAVDTRFTGSGAGAGAGAATGTGARAATGAGSLTVTVGAGARVGSNSVVVKEVPPGATVVGIPARIVEGVAAGEAGQAFSAYAVTTNDNDPLNAILKTLAGRSDQSEAQAAMLIARLAELEAQLVPQKKIGNG